MVLSGIALDDRQVLQIAGIVGHALGSKLVTAYRLRHGVVALTKRERAEILVALEGTPALSDLRDALLAGEMWHMPERLT